MIKFKQTGDFRKLNSYMQKALSANKPTKLDKYGQMGVAALSQYTPKDTGKTAASWYYDYFVTDYGFKIVWSNSNFNNKVPIAIVIQYGHATRNGGYVEGIDYINPAMKPVFEKIADEAWKELGNR